MLVGIPEEILLVRFSFLYFEKKKFHRSLNKSSDSFNR